MVRCQECLELTVSSAVSHKSGSAIATEPAEVTSSTGDVTNIGKEQGVLCDGGSAETEVAIVVQSAWLHGGLIPLTVP